MSIYFAKKFRPKKHKFSLKIIDFLQIFIILTPYQVDENFFVFYEEIDCYVVFILRTAAAFKIIDDVVFTVQTVAD